MFVPFPMQRASSLISAMLGKYGVAEHLTSENVRRYRILARDALIAVVLFPPWFLLAIVALALEFLLVPPPPRDSED
jgi:hypothetical protein